MSVCKKDKVPTKITYQGYSHGFKINVLEEIENGQISTRQAAKKYGISTSGIDKWKKKYGNLDKKLRHMGGLSPQQEIERLKKQLKRAETERDILATAIEIIDDELGIDTKKKFLSSSQKRTLENKNNQSR